MFNGLRMPPRHRDVRVSERKSFRTILPRMLARSSLSHIITQLYHIVHHGGGRRRRWRGRRHCIYLRLLARVRELMQI